MSFEVQKTEGYNEVTFHRAYEGGYAVRLRGELIDYIERSYESGWVLGGDNYQYLSEAKEAARWRFGVFGENGNM